MENSNRKSPNFEFHISIKQDLIRYGKIPERYGENLDEEAPEQMTVSTTEKADAHRRNIREPSANLWKMTILVDLGCVLNQAAKYFKVKFNVNEYKYFLSQMTLMNQTTPSDDIQKVIMSGFSRRK